jgi:hypothetical protein
MSVSAARRIVGQSDRLPMMMATSLAGTLKGAGGDGASENSSAAINGRGWGAQGASTKPDAFATHKIAEDVAARPQRASRDAEEAANPKTEILSPFC